MSESTSATGSKASTEDLNTYLKAVFPDGSGTLHWATNVPGSRNKSDWMENPARWPAISNTIAAQMIREAQRYDVYVCPYLGSTRKRTKGKAAARWVIHADIDGDLDVDKVTKLGGFAIASGTPGHAHVYVPLAESISDSGEHERLCRRLGAVFEGCDAAKCSDNDVLRPPGTLNHKPTLDGGEPAPVKWIVPFDGSRVDGSIERLLDSMTPVGDPTRNGHTVVNGKDVDLSRYPAVRKAVENVSGDRSKDTKRIVAACYDTHRLTLDQTRAIVNTRQDLSGRLDERHDDDVLTCWQKIDDDRRTHIRAEQPVKAAEVTPEPTEFDRVLRLVPASEITSDIPDWVWAADGAGRIQRGVLTLFGGRPGAGKSTAARWFAAQWSRGAFDGCWKGKPQKVAYIASEEALDYVVKPGLAVANADLSKIVFPEVRMNGEAIALMSDIDERQLTEQLKAAGVTVVVVDPIMATVRRKVDIYRNNEMREALAPWVRIAKQLNGTVIGIVHLVKGTTGDVVSSVNGSSAFGEIARCVFGFAADPENKPERVMSQHKNSCGPEDLAYTYEIDVRWFKADSGRSGEMPVFRITGESDITVSDILTARTGQGKRHLSPQMQQVVDLVNSRTETGATVLVEHGLAKNQNSATQMLNRLYKRGHIDNPIYGMYCPQVEGPGRHRPRDEP